MTPHHNATTPRERYEHDIAQHGFVRDPGQERVIEFAQHLYSEICKPIAPVTSTSWLPWARSKVVQRVRGLYLWGGVGRGKTYLVDSLFDSLPFTQKSRRHFQRFMQDVHGDLKRLPKTPDPLKIIAAQIAREIRVLCLDEFHVDDVADAMLLRGLLEALLAQGVTLVFTSNIKPDALYENGLQRERFIPAIELIKRYTDVVYLDGLTDYRKREPGHGSYFVYPFTGDEPQQMRTCYETFSRFAHASREPVWINHRALPVIAHGADIAWFTFDTLCATARSYADYLILAERYPVLLISGLCALSSDNDDVASRLIQLIDAIYDRQVRLIASSDTPLDGLYQGQALGESFRRTQSRLQHLFSSAYMPTSRVSRAG